jgi:hypothetical protein
MTWMVWRPITRACATIGATFIVVTSVSLASGQQAPAPPAPGGGSKTAPARPAAPASTANPAPGGPGSAATKDPAPAPHLQRLRGTVKEVSGGALLVIDRRGKVVSLIVQPTTILSGIRSDGEKVEPHVLTRADLKAGDPITVQYVEMEGKKLAAQVKLQGKSESGKQAK